MKKIELENNLKKYLLFTILIGVFITVIAVTYAWFSSVVIGDSNKQVVTTGTLELVFTDGPEIVANEIYPGDKITKTFTVENTGSLDTSYAINLTEVLNEFINDELIYRLILNENTTNGIVPIEEGPLKEGISIESKEKHEYTIEIEFIETGSEQNYNQGKRFNAVIQIVDNAASNGVKLSLNLDGKNVTELPEDGYYMLDSYECDNRAIVSYDMYQGKINTISDETNESCKLNFVDASNLLVSNILKNNQSNDSSSLTYSSSSGSGLYYTDANTDENDDGTSGLIYFFRGTVENNYVVFGGFCWRIVRTNEDKSTRLRFGGTYDKDNNVCPQTGDAVSVAQDIQFGSSSSSSYVGYTRGTNNVDSVVKTSVDTWYKENILVQGENITNKIANVVYCNDRTDYTIGSDSNHGYYYFAPNYRITINQTPQFECPNLKNDGYTLSVENGGTIGYGNNLLTYPVALLTADEVSYAGGVINQDNKTYYLYLNEDYWTMSPSSHVSAALVYHVSQGNLRVYNYVNAKKSVVPVLSLIHEATVSSGTGLYNDPYIIE